MLFYIGLGSLEQFVKLALRLVRSFGRFGIVVRNIYINSMYTFYVSFVVVELVDIV